MNRSGRRTPRHAANRSDSRSHTALWLLTAFFTLLFLTGGSSRVDVPFLFLARAVAVLLLFYGLGSIDAAEMRPYRHLLFLAGATILLTLLHLVPLPPAIWQILQTHDLVRRVDLLTGLQGTWRPLSLVPTRTLNALYALTIPFAVLLIGVRLDQRDKIKIFYVLLALTGFSAAVGLVQAIGLPISFYHSVGSPESVEAAGVFANQNHQAALLAAGIPMLIVAARLSQGHGWRGDGPMWLAIGCSLAVTVLLVITGSRAGLALGVIAIAFTLFYDLLKIRRLQRLPLSTVVAIKIAAGLGTAAAVVAITMFSSRGLAVDRLASVGSNLRPRLWASIMPLLPGYQPWGSGIGTYVEVYRWREPMSLLRETYSNHAHNEYLEVLMTAGIPGLLLLVIAAVMLTVALWSARRGTEPEDVLARLGAAVVFIMAGASVTDYPLRTPVLAAFATMAAIWCVKSSNKDGVARRS